MNFQKHLTINLIALFLFIIAGMISGCAGSKTTVILLPDHNNKVGEVAVSNTHGTTIIKRAGFGVTMKGEQSPELPFMVAPDQVQNNFSGVLGVEPPQPVKFTLHFENNSAALTPLSKVMIPDIIALIKKNKSTDISIAGHSDRVGDEKRNITLSLKRANRVSNLIVDQGVKAEHIHTSSHGEGNPLIPTADNVAEPKNRRVEVIVR